LQWKQAAHRRHVVESVIYSLLASKLLRFASNCEGAIFMGRRSGLSRCGFAFVALLAMAQARADIINVTITDLGLGDRPSVLAFDFIPGGSSLGNQVGLIALATDGTVQSTSTTGDVTGDGPWLFGDDPNFGRNELLVTLDPTGAALSFSIRTTDIATRAPSDTPDSFSFFILDADLAPLILSDEPGGSNALFQFELGRGENGLSVFGPAQDATLEFTIRASRTPTTPVPEPSTVWLLAWLGAAAVKRRGDRALGRA
jgi:hypothetical protein